MPIRRMKRQLLQQFRAPARPRVVVVPAMSRRAPMRAIPAPPVAVCAPARQCHADQRSPPPRRAVDEATSRRRCCKCLTTLSGDDASASLFRLRFRCACQRRHSGGVEAHFRQAARQAYAFISPPASRTGTPQRKRSRGGRERVSHGKCCLMRAMMRHATPPYRISIRACEEDARQTRGFPGKACRYVSPTSYHALFFSAGIQRGPRPRD